MLYHNFSLRFEKERGGMGQAPKFPMPVNYLFLLRYYQYANQTAALEHVNLTLREMAFGGIYDQAGGGFARYSVDNEWLVPHFEKMLYDNGQLISLYAEAYQITKNSLYKEVVYETISFVERELISPEGGFFSSLDADSEGEEGKFYVFTKEELQEIIGAEEPLFSTYYNVHAEGNWEHNQNILHRRQTDEAFAAEHQLEIPILKELVKGWKAKVMRARSQRVRPGLDDKILTAWNALMLKGLADAYYVFQEEKFRELALKNANFLRQRVKNGPKLFRNYKNGKASINAFLEDYALLIQAFIRLYEITFDENWLNEAHQLTKYTLGNFFDENENLFFYTDKEGEKLIARKKEILDNVIPASNSVMASNLHFLSLYFDQPKYFEISEAMLSQIKQLLVKQPSHLANWANVYYAKLKPTAEIAIVGPEAQSFRNSFADFYFPNAIFAGTEIESDLPLLSDRIAIGEETTIYVCFNKTCQLPVHTVTEALEQLDKINEV
ncbi:thioredoxin domain-containing protein [Adhaeribacter arboris]|uniref:thioredoxin domain-containing protein n=1 Tax=Adhaeribacter arboris TaxID=2072846 RepID=UPI0029371B6A|nr:thioredoxin domain-containing protein [Adhaeribacter arboris]